MDGSGHTRVSIGLPDRLDRLEAAGLVTRVADRADRRRNRFYLTGRGLDLCPVLLEIIRWGGRHAPRSPATPATVKRLFETRAETIASLRTAARAAKRKARPKA